MPALRIHGTGIDNRTSYSVPPKRCAAAPPRVRSEQDGQPAGGARRPCPQDGALSCSQICVHERCKQSLAPAPQAYPGVRRSQVDLHEHPSREAGHRTMVASPPLPSDFVGSSLTVKHHRAGATATGSTDDTGCAGSGACASSAALPAPVCLGPAIFGTPSHG
jgi:hypothetical protein